MWLLHSQQLKLEYFTTAQNVDYAILSHRWESEEVSFQELKIAIQQHRLDEHHRMDVDSSEEDLRGARFRKIQRTRKQARKDELEWVWIDTCCINKESSAELSEAINSMYNYYQMATQCYVYMSDVIPGWEQPSGSGVGRQSPAALSSFKKSAWFTRGWTLQELLAPSEMKFFNYNWHFIGSKQELVPALEEVTHIEAGILRGDILLEEVNVARKMSWISLRQTTREEDMAYCLLGIFDINMPLLYGEGRKAFMRLQLEIIRKSNDESIFAWKRQLKGVEHGMMLQRKIKAPHSHLASWYEPRGWEITQKRESDKLEWERAKSSGSGYKPSIFGLHSGLLAQSPGDFAESGHIRWNRTKRFTRRLPYSMTNQGMQFYVDTYPSHFRIMNRGSTFDIMLNCYEVQLVTEKDGSTKEIDVPIVLTLWKEGYHEDQIWRRHDCLTFQGPILLGSVPKEEVLQATFFIRQDGL